MSKSNFTIAWSQSIADIDQGAWDELALPLATPFLEWDWLHQMEVSGSATAKTGWLPQHLTVWSGPNLVAAAPLYIKGHSAGEFVFDHAWADLASRLGIAYYPKLVGMSPFTPMRGYRFLIAPGADEAALTDIMLHEIDRFCLGYRLSGCSFLFVDPNWQTMIDHPRFSGWMHQSYTWRNLGFETFEDYLQCFNSNQRRNIKRERNAVATQGISLQVSAGDAIPRTHIPIMYDYYVRTNEKFGPWSCKYLNPSFFDGLYRNYRHRLVLVSAYKGGQDQELPIGMSLLVTKGRRLFGRYWGCAEPVKNLHFNACYYAPIEWAVSSGIERFDPGAGGPHKLRRGFSAVPNYSLHRFADPRLREIMRSHIDEINRLEEVQIEALNQAIPFAGPP